jgi:hypothetical protein
LRVSSTGFFESGPKNEGGFVAEKPPSGKKKKEYYWRPFFGV